MKNNDSNLLERSAEAGAVRLRRQLRQTGTMSHLLWHEFIDTNRRAHMVVAEFDPVETIPKSKPSWFELLRTLVVALAPAGDFALTNVRQDDRASILVGFERQVDTES